MKSKLKLFAVFVLLILVLGIGLSAGVVLDRQALTPDPSIPANAQQNFGLMAEAWNTIQKDYVDKSAINANNMTYGAISGMVDSLGDTGHSTFLSPQMVKQEQNFTQGQFDGIGALMEMKNGNATIVAPFDGSPAQKAGLIPGDVITKVEGKDVTGLPLDQIVNQILGPAGTNVTLTVLDPKTGQTRTVTITRAKIQVNNVTWQILPGTTIAQIRIAGFSQGVTKDLQKAITDAKQQGATAIILDLRNDPGGLLSEAIGVASQFLASGNVMLEKDAKGNITPVPVESGGVAPKIPMVVLINGGTASAAEIVSGALQDAHRAQLVGETTFGTGTVLNEFPLSDGSALLLATQEWLTPNGSSFWHVGISPNITVTMPVTVTPLIPEAERTMTAAQLQSSGDTQLLKAVQMLSTNSNSNHGSPSNGSKPSAILVPAVPEPAVQQNNPERILSLELSAIFERLVA
jgi:carboxyl-terminal processing protease